MFKRNAFLPNSTLYDQNSFYKEFYRDIQSAYQQMIIESPFITTRRINDLLTIFQKLRRKDVSIIVNTRNPSALSPICKHIGERDASILCSLLHKPSYKPTIRAWQNSRDTVK